MARAISKGSGVVGLQKSIFMMLGYKVNLTFGFSVQGAPTKKLSSSIVVFVAPVAKNWERKTETKLNHERTVVVRRSHVDPWIDMELSRGVKVETPYLPMTASVPAQTRE